MCATASDCCNHLQSVTECRQTQQANHQVRAVRMICFTLRMNWWDRGHSYKIRVIITESRKATLLESENKNMQLELRSIIGPLYCARHLLSISCSFLEARVIIHNPRSSLWLVGHQQVYKSFLTHIKCKLMFCLECFLNSDFINPIKALNS